ncbi:MAG TPA: hypothetical protein VG297_08620 [Bryobacteraceae bacterium]|jgi:hypothetical protein|nr:hypothetical protein [Bryobacteraceae bacterium]
MNPRPLLTAAIVAAIATICLAPSVTAQQQPAVVAHPKVDAGDKVYPLDQIITASVHDAWLLSGKNEEAFFDIVEQLAQVSAEKRGVSLPDSAAAGKRMGEIIKQKARADHDQLLYVVVDQAVRAVGARTTAAAKK